MSRPFLIPPVEATKPAHEYPAWEREQKERQLPFCAENAVATGQQGRDKIRRRQTENVGENEAARHEPSAP
jgi:hypothetical protein